MRGHTLGFSLMFSELTNLSEKKKEKEILH
jgi:hypothetical protein